MNDRTYTLSRDNALIVHQIVRSDIAAHKNWICGAVERGEVEAAQALVKHMRKLETIASSLNVEAHEETYKG